MAAGRFRVATRSQEWIAVVAGERVTLSDTAEPFVVHIDADGCAGVTGPDGTFSAVAVRAGDRVWVAIEGETLELTITEGTRRTASAARDEDAMAAPMAATVVRINVTPGAVVQDGDVLVALEAMKMELPIRAPRDGIVKAIHCREGELVQQGAVVVELA